MDRNLKLRYSRWNHYRISQDFAHDVYSDERHPIPEKTVVSVANFKGWDRYGNRPAGAAEPTGGVALREVVRRLLQRKANACFLNTMHHGAGEFDPRIVNPYGNKLEGFQVRVERKRSDDPVPTFIDQD